VTGSLDKLDWPKLVAGRPEPSLLEFRFHVLDLNTEACFKVTVYYYLEVIIHPCHARVKNACNGRIYFHGVVIRGGGEGQHYLYAYIALFYGTVSAYLRTIQAYSVEDRGRISQCNKISLRTVFMPCTGKLQQILQNRHCCYVGTSIFQTFS
jgi:hypothetical protein